MTRVIFAAVATARVSALVFGLQQARTYRLSLVRHDPEQATGSVYFDAVWLIQECYSKGNILGGNRGFCNPSPYYVAGSAEQSQTRKRRARPQ